MVSFLYHSWFHLHTGETAPPRQHHIRCQCRHRWWCLQRWRWWCGHPAICQSFCSSKPRNARVWEFRSKSALRTRAHHAFTNPSVSMLAMDRPLAAKANFPFRYSTPGRQRGKRRLHKPSCNFVPSCFSISSLLPTQATSGCVYSTEGTWTKWT